MGVVTSRGVLVTRKYGKEVITRKIWLMRTHGNNKTREVQDGKD